MLAVRMTCHSFERAYNLLPSLSRLYLGEFPRAFTFVRLRIREWSP